jgi:hypothetical protein
MVDTYAAQHPVADGPRIGLAFALIGLYLALDEGWRGDQVRDAHQLLASTAKDWPRFERLGRAASMTVFDVAIAGSADAHARLIQRWAKEVWAMWRDHRTALVALLDARLSAEARTRILAD